MSTANLGTSGKAGLSTSKFTLQPNGVLTVRVPAPNGVGDNQALQEAADFAERTSSATINA